MQLFHKNFQTVCHLVYIVCPPVILFSHLSYFVMKMMVGKDLISQAGRPFRIATSQRTVQLFEIAEPMTIAEKKSEEFKVF